MFCPGYSGTVLQSLTYFQGLEPVLFCLFPISKSFKISHGETVIGNPDLFGKSACFEQFKSFFQMEDRIPPVVQFIIILSRYIKGVSI